jgi:hypothetical protein
MFNVTAVAQKDVKADVVTAKPPALLQLEPGLLPVIISAAQFMRTYRLPAFCFMQLQARGF